MRVAVFHSCRTIAIILALLGVACGDDDSVELDAGSDASEPAPDMRASEDMDAEPPDADGPRDAETDQGTDLGPPCDGPPGLYVDPGCTVLAGDVESYNPRYWLWSDGTDKQRFISLPADSVIDTTDPDNWTYPVGTRLWKTFLTADGTTRLETRYFEKVAEGVGPDFWDMRTFAWNAAQDAVEEVIGGRENVLGTEHDIPSGTMCLRCHAEPGRADVISGFTAIQLNHGDTAISLDQLNLRGLLSAEIPLADAHVASDGDARYAAGLGYLHANCGHCHGDNGRVGSGPAAGMILWSNVGTASFAESDVNRTAVNIGGSWALMGATARIVPGSPDTSSVFIRAGSREPGIQMPLIGTEVVDEDGQATLRTFITALGE